MSSTLCSFYNAAATAANLWLDCSTVHYTAHGTVVLSAWLMFCYWLQVTAVLLCSLRVRVSKRHR